MREVEIGSIPVDRLATLLGEERTRRLVVYAERARTLLEGRTVWNVNATASGGGVAEMLEALLAYGRGERVDTRWLVLDGTEEFFHLTKRLHNILHGVPGDGGPTGPAERSLYEEVLADNLVSLRERVAPGDIVILHDPQTAALVAGMREAGAHVAWRCHIGRDTPNELTDRGWEFLRPYVEQADAVIFSRKEYVPDWVDQDRLWLIPPSLDPFSPKNCELSRAAVEAALRRAHLAELPEDHGSLDFDRRDGSWGTVRAHHDLMVGGGPVPDGARVVLQVSRWDRLKDMPGVLSGFVAVLDRLPDDVHLMLVGPATEGVSDDPEGAEVLAACEAQWRRLPAEAAARVHLCCLPMDDVDENAHLVNALQRFAAVVVQKSLCEGFGLTVTEPMWKGRPVIGSRVGGIQDQIVDGVSGLLLDDPADLDEFGRALERLLRDGDLADRLGAAARERVRDRFLGDRHLVQYVDLFEHLLAVAAGAPPPPRRAH